MGRVRSINSLVASAALALGVAAFAGCGSSDEDASPPPEPAASQPSGQSAAPASPEQAAIDGYRAFAVDNAERHVDGFRRFAAAIEAGEIDRAKTIYPEARMPWERIEPVAGLFGALDPAIDAREGDVPDETWGGWHYFEKRLWVEESTDGLASFIEETEADATKLVEVARTIELTPADIATGAVDLLGEVSASKITGEEERYSHTDLYDFQANVEGSKAAFEAVAPLVADRELVDEISGRFTELLAALEGYREGDGFVAYTEVGESQRRELSRLIDATAEPLSRVAAAVE
ncbi:MAG: EfeM/EfeO family lipoprotein [Actinomycetota bacterium]|nr:EfeM/EfeO family lipoprotein [Actinomycetota bacterium]